MLGFHSSCTLLWFILNLPMMFVRNLDLHSLAPNLVSKLLVGLVGVCWLGKIFGSRVVSIFGYMVSSVKDILPYMSNSLSPRVFYKFKKIAISSMA